MTCKRQAGFTLIEVLVAFTVLALVLGALYRVFGASARQAQLAQDYAQAVAVAEARLSEAGRLAPLAPGQEKGLVGRFTWVRTIAVHSENVFLVETRIFWPAGGAPRTLSLTTLRMAP